MCHLYFKIRTERNSRDWYAFVTNDLCANVQCINRTHVIVGRAGFGN